MEQHTTGSFDALHLEVNPLYLSSKVQYIVGLSTHQTSRRPKYIKLLPSSKEP